MSGGSIGRNYLTSFASEGAFIVSYLLVFRIVARHFGPTGFAEYALSRRTLSLLLPLGVLGLDVALARAVAYAIGERSPGHGAYLPAALGLLAGAVGLASASLLTFQRFFAQLFFGSPAYTDLVVTLPVLLAGAGLHAVAYGQLRGRLQIQRANLLMVLTMAAAPLICALVIGGSVSRLLLAIGVSWIAIAIAFLTFMPIAFAGTAAAASILSRFSLPRLPGDLLQLALFALPGILIAHIASLATAGSVAFGVAALGMVGSTAFPVSFVLLPLASRLLAEGRPDLLRAHVMQVAAWLVGGLLVLLIGLEVFASPIVVAYLGPEFRGTVGLLQLTLLAALPWGFYVSFKSVIDARHVAAINARNIAIAFTLFVPLAAAAVLFTSAPAMVVAAFVASLYVLGILTVVEVYRVTVR